MTPSARRDWVRICVWFATHWCVCFRKHSFGGRSEFPESEGLRHRSRPSEENRLPPPALSREDVWAMCAAQLRRRSRSGGRAAGEHHPPTPHRSQFTRATLFLSRKPDSNSSHMSVITEESDETLMSLSIFPSLSLCVSFPPIFIFYCLIVVLRNPQVYALTRSIYIAVFGTEITAETKKYHSLTLSVNLTGQGSSLKHTVAYTLKLS